MKKIGIFGRTNVGKSTLFNRIIKQSKSIESDIPGTTRDFISGNFFIGGEEVELIDFGGFDFSTTEKIEKNVQEKILKELKIVDLIVFVVDGKCGVSEVDEKISEILRKAKKPIVFAVNKVESKSDQEGFYDFYRFGFGEMIAISAANNKNLDELIDLIGKGLGLKKKKARLAKDTDAIKVSIIGKPNVGKSSIFNHLYGEERSIVTDIAGTTRDAVDAKIKIQGEDFIFVDTAGLRRRTKTYKMLDKASSFKSISAIKKSNMVLYVIDAANYATDYDIQLLNYAWKNGKSIAIVVNKWDIKPPDVTEKKFREILEADNSIFKNFPFVFVSAVKGSGFEKMEEEIVRLAKRSSLETKTSVLNRVIGKIVSSYSLFGMKFFYATQIGREPIEFLIFVNKEKLFKKKYISYLEKNLREQLDLSGVPIRIRIRGKDR